MKSTEYGCDSTFAFRSILYLSQILLGSVKETSLGVVNVLMLLSLLVGIEIVIYNMVQEVKCTACVIFFADQKKNVCELSVELVLHFLRHIAFF